MKDAIARIHEHMRDNVRMIDNLRNDFDNLKAQIQNNDPAKYKKGVIPIQNPESIKNTGNPISTTGSPSITGTSSDDKTEEGKADEDETQK